MSILKHTKALLEFEKCFLCKIFTICLDVIIARLLNLEEKPHFFLWHNHPLKLIGANLGRAVYCLFYSCSKINISYVYGKLRLKATVQESSADSTDDTEFYADTSK